MKNLSVKVPDDFFQEMRNHADSKKISISDLLRASVERALYLQEETVEPAYDLLCKELEFKNQQLEQANEARQRSDTIIMQLTKQLESQTLLLEDMRDRSLWKRVKMAFGFASA